jgi:hypothetical protein
MAAGLVQVFRKYEKHGVVFVSLTDGSRESVEQYAS